MTSLSSIKWDNIKAVVFDVDGTLYEQARLRRSMMVDLLTYYSLRPWRVREMLILRRFRAEREKRAGIAGPGLERAQYTWGGSADAKAVAQVRQVVDRWMFRHPNQYLPGCIYPGTQEFFVALRQRGIKIGIYSDYRAHDKLAAMGLTADLVVSSTDPEVDHLKPAPQGLLYICRALGVAPAECLFIGDRPELDGICAERAGMPYLIVEKQPFHSFTFYQLLQQHLAANLTTTTHHESTIVST